MVKRIVALLLCALTSPVASAQETSTEPAQQEIVEQILDLQRQLEELMATLPPEVRVELRQRLAATMAPPEPAKKPPEAVTITPATKPGVESMKPAIEPVAAPAHPPPIAPATATTAAITEPSPGTIDKAPPAVEPLPSDGIPKLIRRRSRRAPCNTLRPLDENGDGKISSADRYWRHLYLWTDKNGDRQIQDREVESAYDRRVREIAVSLETFTRTKGGLGEIRIEDQVVLDLRGDGFSERDRRDDGVLVADAGALNRADGLRLLGPGGEALNGFVPFRSGLRFELSGQVTELNCP